jgi:uncharacterized protein DUF5666
MIRLLSILSLSFALSGCAAFGPVVISSQSPVGAESGVGGTGFTDTWIDGDEGVGGTGISYDVAEGDEGVGGTGIFGIISAFGSIVVNGVHIDYEPETPVSVDGEKGTPADFAIGQLVAVEADPIGARYQARIVEIQHAVVGPVSERDSAARTITVLGQTVRVNSSDRLPAVGEWVRVSGLRDTDELVVATRIDAALSAGDALVRGIVTPADGDAFTLGRLRLSSTDLRQQGLRFGDEVLVRGRFGEDGFKIRDFSKEPSLPFGGRMEQLLIEGYISPNALGGARIAGHAWLVPADIVDLLPESHRADGAFLPVLLKGRGGNGDWHVEGISQPALPALNGAMPWHLEQDGLRPGALPDLLRDTPGNNEPFDRRQGATIDPTLLPAASQLSAALSAKGLPPALLTMSQPLTEDQLSTVLTLGGADLNADGPIEFDPSLLKAVLENREQFAEFFQGGRMPAGFENTVGIGTPEFRQAFQNLQERGVDPSQMQIMLHNVGENAQMLQVLGRIHFHLEEAGLDPSTIPPAMLEHIEDVVKANARRPR